MATEVPDRSWLRLRDNGAQQALDHTGTGELVPLEGTWSLHFDAHGFGLLQRAESDNDEQPEQRWAADLLAWRMFETSGPDKRTFL